MRKNRDFAHFFRIQKTHFEDPCAPKTRSFCNKNCKNAEDNVIKCENSLFN